MGGDKSIVRWVVAAVAALAVVALLVWADRHAGIDDRDPKPEDVQVSTDAAPASLAPGTAIQ
jgi:hypothetical protein